MESDASRSTNNQQENEHKVARVLLAPLIWINRGLSAILKKALGTNYADVTEDEVRDLVDALASSDDDEEGIEENSAQMINNIFEYDNLTAADVMTHRTSIVGVDINTITLDDLIYLALDLGFSRIPVYEDSVDKIVGIVIVKDLLSLIGTDLSEFKINSFLRDVIFIPEACPCPDLFKSLTEQKAGFAVVVDEYGGTAGIVTLEDIIEAVMGNIQDEYDDEKQMITDIGDDTYDVDGETNPEEVFELFGVELPENHEYETVSGFVADKLGYIPEGSEIVPPSVEYEGVKLVVLQVEDRNMVKIRVSRIADEGKE